MRIIITEHMLRITIMTFTCIAGMVVWFVWSAIEAHIYARRYEDCKLDLTGRALK